LVFGGGPSRFGVFFFFFFNQRFKILFIPIEGHNKRID